jgi:hypothetical protein
MDDHPPIEVLIPIGRLRTMFNDAGLAERAMYGDDDIYTTIEDDGHPSPPLVGEPHCTRSQILAYRDDGGKEIARAHRYLRPDGRMGLAGKPDPREMLGDDGVWYIGGNYPNAEGD